MGKKNLNFEIGLNVCYVWMDGWMDGSISDNEYDDDDDMVVIIQCAKI